MKHPRREFLLRVLAACGTPLMTAVASSSAAPRSQADARKDANLQIAAAYFGGGVDAARAIGEAYLRHGGVAEDRESILDYTSGTRQILAAALTEVTALSALVAAVRNDFQEGRVVTLEGWVVSLTEAELCVLTLLPASM